MASLVSGSGAGSAEERLSAPPSARLPPRLPSRFRISDETLALVTASVVIGATALALWLRVTGLRDWHGTLSIDEARLALAGRGILEHGVPVLPTDWVYTRGLLAAYLVASSFALLGQTDFAARLPSALAGTALVPAAYLLGRSLAGRAGGLFAAVFVAGYPPLVVWSRQAWLYALYVLLYTVALLFIVRAHQGARARDQLLAAAFVGLTFLAHELGVFLLLPLGVQVGARLCHCRRAPRHWWAPLAALALAAGAAVLLWVLVTGLRAETLAGAFGEVAEYVSPRLDGTLFRFYGRMLVDSWGLILAAALLGIPLAVARRRFEALLLWLALLPPFVHAVTTSPYGPQERYGLTLIVVLVALAAHSAGGWATWAVRRCRSRQLSPSVLAGLVLAVIFVVHQDVGRALERGALSPREGAWLREVRSLGIGPDDLVMSDLPTVVGWYLGDLDYWVSSRRYQEFTLRIGELPRDVHTGAVLIRNVSEFQRLVIQPNPGRTLWVLASGRRYHWGYLMDDELRALLERSATLRVNPGNRSNLQFGSASQILRIDLP